MTDSSAKGASAAVPQVQNTAGEWEPESWSPRANVVEALAVYTAILVTLWPFAYGVGVLPHRAWVQTVAGVGLGLGGVFGVLFRLSYTHWPDVARFFNVHRLVLAGVPVRELRTVAWGQALVVTVGVLLAAFIVTCAIRYDNFGPAVWLALRVAVPLAALIGLGALVNGAHLGANPFRGLTVGRYLLDVFGYAFWGFVQQLLFTAYLGTRFRKGFAPASTRENRVPARQRWRVTLGLGAGLALGLALLGYAGVRGAYEGTPGPGRVPVHVPLVLCGWLLAFFLPLTLVYGWVYTRDKRRLLVATLAASCFALIHIDSYGLVAATWLLGIILIYVSMEDRYRNLAALGFIHGVLGSSLGRLFANRSAGILWIDYCVGPWNVRHPHAGVLVFPLVCIAVFAVLTVWYGRRLPGDRPVAGD